MMKDDFFNRLMVIALISFAMPVCGMELEELVVNVKLAHFTAGSLVYVSQELVDRTNELLQMSCPKNMPFLPLHDELGKFTVLNGYKEALPRKVYENDIPNGLGNIRYLPLSVFTTESGSCKKKNDRLLTAKNGDQWVCLKLISEVSDDWIEGLEDSFGRRPNYVLGVKDELLKADIIEDFEGRIIHGPKGYFKHEIGKTITFFHVSWKTATVSIVLLLAAAYACYKHQDAMSDFLKAFKLPQ